MSFAHGRNLIVEAEAAEAVASIGTQIIQLDGTLSLCESLLDAELK